MNKKLTPQQVLEIRASTESARKTAEKYDICHSLVVNIRNKKAYADVKSPDGISNRRGNRAKATKVQKVQDEARARSLKGKKIKFTTKDYSDVDALKPGELTGWTAVPVDGFKVTKPLDLTPWFAGAHAATLGALVLLLIKVMG